MAGRDISSKVKKGLFKARVKTGGGGVGLVEIRTLTGGSNDPINPTPPTESWGELKDCIFSSVNKNIIDGDLIQSGDIQFVTNCDIEINQSDIIRRSGKEYIVKTIDDKNPTGITLAYKGTARLQ